MKGFIENYKGFTIYENNFKMICFKNKKYNHIGCRSVKSAKNRITRAINKMNKRERRSLNYLKLEDLEG